MEAKALSQRLSCFIFFFFFLQTCEWSKAKFNLLIKQETKFPNREGAGCHKAKSQSLTHSSSLFQSVPVRDQIGVSRESLDSLFHFSIWLVIPIS